MVFWVYFLTNLFACLNVQKVIYKIRHVIIEYPVYTDAGTYKKGTDSHTLEMCHISTEEEQQIHSQFYTLLISQEFDLWHYQKISSRYNAAKT
jgi:hypothetical protein